MPLSRINKVIIIILLVINGMSLYGSNEEVVVRIKCDEAYPPFQYLDENGRPAGFDIDLIQALAVVMGMKTRIETAAWYEMVNDLQKNEADLIPGMYVRPDRLRNYEFSTPILVSFHSFFIRKDGRIKSYNDILTATDTINVIVYNSQILKDYLERLNKGIKLTYVEDNLQGLQLLASGKCDAMLLPKYVGWYLIDKNKLSNLKQVGLPVLPRDYVIAAKKGNSGLIMRINQGLSILQETGEYDRIYKKWFAKYETDNRFTIWFHIALAIFGIVVLVLVTIVLSNYLLRKQVSKQTVELNRKIDELARAHKLLEEEKERAVRTDRLKSAFLANMSHEIRTPMNAIIGFSELLADPDLTQKERDYYAGLVNINTGTLLNLINDIIDISKIEAHELTLRLEPIEPHNILTDMLPVFHNELHRKHKEQLVLSYEPASYSQDIFITVDPHRFRQIITNLVVNAVKFTTDGYISYGFLVPENQMVRFFVRDSGAGISKENQAVIFDRFRQLEQGRHFKQQGAGLGLSITKGLIELMGGKLWLESEVGKGSTFWFTLPVAQQQ